MEHAIRHRWMKTQGSKLGVGLLAVVMLAAGSICASADEASVSGEGRIEVQTVGEDRYDLMAHDATLDRVVAALADAAGADVRIGDGLDVPVAVGLTSVSFDEALAQLCDNFALVHERAGDGSLTIRSAHLVAEGEEASNSGEAASDPAKPASDAGPSARFAALTDRSGVSAAGGDAGRPALFDADAHARALAALPAAERRYAIRFKSRVVGVTKTAPTTAGAGEEVALVQFEKIPTSEQRSTVEKLGARFERYATAQAYYLRVPSAGALGEILELPFVRGVAEIMPEDKMARELVLGPAEAIEHAQAGDDEETGEYRLNVTFFPSVQEGEAVDLLKRLDVEPAAEAYLYNNVIRVRASLEDARRIAATSFVHHVAPVPPKPVPLNYDAAALSNIDRLRGGYPGTGYAVGMWEPDVVITNQEDCADIDWPGFEPDAAHLAFGSRVMIAEAYDGLCGEARSLHATMVAGTLGADIPFVDSRTRAEGMAPGVSIFAYGHNRGSGLLDETFDEQRAAVADYGIVVANHSWGEAPGYIARDFYGGYPRVSVQFDSLMRELRDERFMAVKAVGNNRGLFVDSDGDGMPDAWEEQFDCVDAQQQDADEDPDEDGYDNIDEFLRGGDPCDETVTEGDDGLLLAGSDGRIYDTISQDSTAKNILVVGATDDDGRITLYSASGPTDDGRIKPDLVANGELLFSTQPADDYGLTDSLQGTSYATPVVSGMLTVLNDVFDVFQPAGQTDLLPRTEMWRGLAIHTAQDLGREGPDYLYGWGLADALSAAEILALHSPTNPIVRQASIPNHEEDVYEFRITNPEDVRITLAWTDDPGDENAALTLVNDLDLQVVGPDGTVHLPYVMPYAFDRDADPAALAVRDVNRVDNVEVVEIEEAPAGDYQVVVRAHRVVGVDPQTYSLFVPPEDPVPAQLPTTPTVQVRSNVDRVQAEPYALNGSGYAAGIWEPDGGYLPYVGWEVDAEHPAFEGRAAVVEPHPWSDYFGLDGRSDHATVVAGVVGAADSPNPIAEGMAPECELLSYGVAVEELYDELPRTYFDEQIAAVHEKGIVVANHSWGRQPVSVPGYFGAYTEESARWDVMMRELADTRFTVVKSAGNSGSWFWIGKPGSDEYYYDTILSAGKNEITVGATDDEDVVADFSSTGPTDDGRIKPDLVANGVSVISTYPEDLYTDSTDPTSDRYWVNWSGTSFSGPAVAGIVVLLNEAFDDYGAAATGLDPRSDLFKAILIHTAADLGRPGPDFLYGWGLADALAAVRLVEDHGPDSRHLFQGRLADGDEDRYRFELAGADSFRVTLCWADEPGDPNVLLSLVNDLDLIVIGPGGAHLPYVMPIAVDPSVDPAAPAVRGENRVDTVEVVEAFRVPEGAYEVIVRGGAIPTGSAQSYTLAVSEATEPDEVLVTRVQGTGPAAARLQDGSPVIAWQETESGTSQVFAKYWSGDELPATDEWVDLDGRWLGFGDSGLEGGVSRSMAGAAEAAIAVDAENRPVVAWVEDLSPDSEIYLRRWDGAAWGGIAGSDTGGGVSDNGGVSQQPSVTVDRDGRTYVAWSDDSSGAFNIFVRRYDPATGLWEDPSPGSSSGTGISGTMFGATEPSIAIDDENRPAVAFRRGQHVVVHRLDAGTWENLLGPGGLDRVNTSVAAAAPSLASDPATGQLYLAWSDEGPAFAQVYLRRWDGEQWQQLGGSATGGGVSDLPYGCVEPSLSVIQRGLPVVTWTADAYGTPEIRAARWTEVVLEEGDEPRWTGMGFAAEHDVVAGPPGPSEDPVVVPGHEDAPVVAYVHGGEAEEIGVKAFASTYYDAPRFAGVTNAVSLIDAVRLEWKPAVTPNIFYLFPPITYNVRYNVYMADASGGQDFADPVTNFFDTASGVVQMDGTTCGAEWHFVVRAEDYFGNEDDNTAEESATFLPTGEDCDGDGILNEYETNTGEYRDEFDTGTDPLDPDSDDDGIPDGWEVDNGLNPLDASDALLDLDEDGLENRREAEAGTNPNNPHSDGPDSCLADGYEVDAGLDPLDVSDDDLTASEPWTAAMDPDGDTLSNCEEAESGSDPFETDTDWDGLGDGEEVDVYGTSPADADSDRDGLADGEEVSVFFTDPAVADSDGDLVADGDEVSLNRDPTVPTPPYFWLTDTFGNATIYDVEGPESDTWTTDNPNPAFPDDLWHVTEARGTEPDALNPAHSPTHSWRLALSDPADDPSTTYQTSRRIVSALVSPTIDVSSPVLANLFVQWNERFSTEVNNDTCTVQVSTDGVNWKIVRPGVSGESGGWQSRVIELTDYLGGAVQVRFLFQTLDGNNNLYEGWYVDDVILYEGSTIDGRVFGARGCPLEGASVSAQGVDGTVFGSAITEFDGSYRISGLPAGEYYVKAEAVGFKAEYWNGAGVDGVHHRDDVGATVDVSVPGTAATIDFQMDFGISQAFVAVRAFGGATEVVGRRILVGSEPLQVWDGADGFVDLVTPAAVRTGAVDTNIVTWAASGSHWLQLERDGDAFPLSMWVEMRPGETRDVAFQLSTQKGVIQVDTPEDSGWEIVVDYRPTGIMAPAVITDVAAGSHTVFVRKDLTWPAPREVTVAPGVPALVMFEREDLQAPTGSVLAVPTDPRGEPVPNATVYVDYIPVTFGTPATVDSIMEGDHVVTLAAPGYQGGEAHPVRVAEDRTSDLDVILRPADREFDDLEDSYEEFWFGSIFAQAAADDFDGDGLTNGEEQELAGLGFLVPVDPTSEDTDEDLLTDGFEVAYDGSGTFAEGFTAGPTMAGSGTVEALYAEYLEDPNGAGTAVASIEGDMFAYTDVRTGLVTDPASVNYLCILYTFEGVPTDVMDPLAITVDHEIGSSVLGDLDPTLPDTDGDGMYDGFEQEFGPVPNPVTGLAADLDPLEAGRAQENVDADSLVNIDEFLGGDGLAYHTGRVSNGLDDNGNWDILADDVGMDGLPGTGDPGEGDGQPNPGEPNVDEVAEGYDYTDPTTPDTDGDGMPDGWEILFGLDPLDPEDGLADPDGDELVNVLEYENGANPLRADSDSDYLDDGEEVLVYGTDPTAPDTDGDGLTDGQEVADTDFDPTNGLDGGFNTDPLDEDSDGDGMPDGFEVLDNDGNPRPQPLLPNFPGDANLDPDEDGLTNLQEYRVMGGGDFTIVIRAEPILVVWQHSTDPRNPDTDGDGMGDGWEVENLLHPVDAGATKLAYSYELGPRGDAALDADGLWNLGEYRVRDRWGDSTDPRDADCDGDGVPDGLEMRIYLTNPLDVDTDGDRLHDGNLAGIGEVDATGSFKDYDLALGDMWAFVYDPDSGDPFWINVTDSLSSEEDDSVVPGRWGHQIVYNADRQQLMLHGGRGNGTSARLQDTWECVYNDFKKGWSKSADFDEDPLQYGYVDINLDTGDQWELNYGGRSEYAMAHHDEGDVTVMFGGWRQDNVMQERIEWRRPIIFDNASDVETNGPYAQGSVATETLLYTHMLTSLSTIGAEINDVYSFAGDCALYGDGSPTEPPEPKVTILGETLNPTNSTVESTYVGFHFQGAGIPNAQFIRSATLEMTPTAVNQPVRNNHLYIWAGNQHPEDGTTLPFQEVTGCITNDTVDTPWEHWATYPSFYSFAEELTFPAGAIPTMPVRFGGLREIVQDLVLWQHWGDEPLNLYITDASPGDGVASFVDWYDAEAPDDHSPPRLYVEYTVRPPWRDDAASGAGEFPPPRIYASMAYDSGTQVCVMFGGIDGNGVLRHSNDPDAAGYGWGDTHRYSINSWSKVDPGDGAAPSPRWGHTLTSVGGTMILFGGFDENGSPLNDMWSFNPQNNTWTEISPAPGDLWPAPRGRHCMAYYGGWDRLVLFGGFDGSRSRNDTWRWEGGVWLPEGSLDATHAVLYEELFTPDLPTPRQGSSMVYASNFPRFQTEDEEPIGAIYMFGGWRGADPTLLDTDGDLVADGDEHAISGGTAGRDPRLNADYVYDTNTAYLARYEMYPETPVYDYIYRASSDTSAVQNIMGDLVEDDEWTHRNDGPPVFDDTDEWGVGWPVTSGVEGAPAYAFDGRRLFGTDLGGTYENNADQTLISPLIHVDLPGTGDSTNRYYVSWAEWLDLEPVGDFVSFFAIRPSTPVDVLNRTGLETLIMPERDGSHSNLGWRRQTVSLDPIQEGSLFFAWNLRSDPAGTAAGWYLDDIRVFLPGEIEGSLAGAAPAGKVVEARGSDGSVIASAVSDATGHFLIGPLPSGRYTVYPEGGEPIVVNVGVGETVQANGGAAIPVGDVDGDGLPDSWEDAYPCVIVGVVDDDDDPDDDGQTNAEEFAAGTDPCDPDSVMRILAIARDGANVRITWASEPGCIYRVWATDTMDSWFVVGDDVIADGTTEDVLDEAAPPQRLYRVELLVN